jgi:hypothetical protein
MRLSLKFAWIAETQEPERLYLKLRGINQT